MRVISMVPSWTETLLACGVNVVGRTRYCIHPEKLVSAIPIVGGTKDISWDKATALTPDLLILDKEENPLAMSEKSPFKFVATHVTSVKDVGPACRLLARSLEKSNGESFQKLCFIADRWENVASHPVVNRDLADIPGVVEWINPLKPGIENFLYLIWKKPWMTIGKQTFIGSMLSHVGLSKFQLDFENSYPEVDLEKYPPEKTLLLCSTEPFPFLKKKNDLKTLGSSVSTYSIAIVDGESYSWFGIRALEFLESL